MLDIDARQLIAKPAGPSRRDFLRVGVAGALGLSLPEWLRLKAFGMVAEGQAKSVIQLWMAGGPPHTDTFDPKPQAGPGFTGPFRGAIDTNVSGIRVGELLPLLAQQADKYTIIRSVTHGNNAHETAAYIMQTGTLPAGNLVYPAMGAVAALKHTESGDSRSLPPYITLTSRLRRFSEAGFLSNGCKTFTPGGDPNAREFRVQGLAPPRGMTSPRLQERRALPHAIEALARQAEKQDSLRTMDAYEEKAYGLILGDARKAFDLSEEKDALRNRYGRNTFGQSCLLARRLAECGVPFITVNDPGWDTHTYHFEAMRTKLPILDAGFATLLDDLAQRGLLASTIVTWYGEFGRTPRVWMEPPWFGGRQHFGNCFSAVVAGGGFQGGQIVGATDSRGENLIARPVYPWDLSASMYRLLGIDPHGTLPHPHGCVARVTPLASGTVQSGGLLTEIMRA
jgi:hypothetical protein